MRKRYKKLQKCMQPLNEDFFDDNFEDTETEMLMGKEIQLSFNQPQFVYKASQWLGASKDAESPSRSYLALDIADKQDGLGVDESA
jgi:hypothetical protein